AAAPKVGAKRANRGLLLVRTEIDVREEHPECRLRERPLVANLIARDPWRRGGVQPEEVEGQRGVVGDLGELRAPGVDRPARVEEPRPRCRDGESRRPCAGSREESDQRPRHYPPSAHRPTPLRLACLPKAMARAFRSARPTHKGVRLISCWTRPEPERQLTARHSWLLADCIHMV